MVILRRKAECYSMASMLGIDEAARIAPPAPPATNNTQVFLCGQELLCGRGVLRGQFEALGFYDFLVVDRGIGNIALPIG